MLFRSQKLSAMAYDSTSIAPNFAFKLFAIVIRQIAQLGKNAHGNPCQYPHVLFSWFHGIMKHTFWYCILDAMVECSIVIVSDKLTNGRCFTTLLFKTYRYATLYNTILRYNENIIYFKGRPKASILCLAKYACQVFSFPEYIGALHIAHVVGNPSLPRYCTVK